MKSLIINSLLLIALILPLSAFPSAGDGGASNSVTSLAQTSDTRDEAALRQLESDWVNAFLKKDPTALGKILAADWEGQYPWGNENRAQALTAVSSAEDAIASITMDDMNVRVFGDIAFIQGSDDEKSSYAGTDTSGHYSWTDTFAKRAGQWVAIASQLTLVTAQ